MVDTSFLYFDLVDRQVYRKATDDYESFTPTVECDEGYLLYVEVSHYDSNGPYGGKGISVVDLYPDLETARTMAKRIAARRFEWDTRDGKNPEAVKADGSKVYEHWTNWGESFEKAVVHKVRVLDSKEFTTEEFR